MGNRSWGLLSLGLVFLELFTAALQAHDTLLPAVHAPARPVSLIPFLKPSSLFLCQLTSPFLERLLNYLKLTADIFFDASSGWFGLVNSSLGCQRSQRWLPSVRSWQFGSPPPPHTHTTSTDGVLGWGRWLLRIQPAQASLGLHFPCVDTASPPALTSEVAVVSSMPPAGVFTLPFLPPSLSSLPPFLPSLPPSLQIGRAHV